MRIVFCLVEPMFCLGGFWFLVFRISWEYSPRFFAVFLSFCLHTFAYLLSTAKLKIMLPARLLYKNIKYFTRFQFQLLHANSKFEFKWSNAVHPLGLTFIEELTLIWHSLALLEGPFKAAFSLALALALPPVSFSLLIFVTLFFVVFFEVRCTVPVMRFALVLHFPWPHSMKNRCQLPRDSRWPGKIYWKCLKKDILFTREDFRNIFVERGRESERERARIVARSLFWRPDQALDDLAKLWYKRDVYTRISKVLHVANMNVYLIIYLFMFVACQYLDEWRKTAKKCRNAACNERFSFILQRILQQFTMFFYFSLSININYLNVPILYAWCCLFSFFPVKFGPLLDFLD